MPCIDHASVSGSCAVCDPYASARFEQRFHSRNEPARRPLDDNPAIRCTIVSKWLAVGEHDD
jgi:hypothetical protein